MQEWSIEIDFRHDLTKPKAEDLIFDVLERMSSYAAVGSLGRRVLSVRFDVKASTAAQAMGDGQRLLSATLTELGFSKPLEILHVELETVEELDRRLGEPTLPPLAGITEVAQILGVSRQRAHQLSQTADLPTPLATLASGPIWNRHAIDRFKERWTRRPGRPRLERLRPPKSASTPMIRGKSRR